MAYAACSAFVYKKVQPGNREESACSPQMLWVRQCLLEGGETVNPESSMWAQKENSGRDEPSDLQNGIALREGKNMPKHSWEAMGRHFPSMQETVTFPAGAQLPVRQPKTCITSAPTSQEPPVIKYADKGHGSSGRGKTSDKDLIIEMGMDHSSTQKNTDVSNYKVL